MGSKFGWCMEGNHTLCTTRFKRWYIGPVRKGRKKVDAIIYLDEYIECSCKCHTDVDDEKPKPKPRRRKK